MLILFNNKFIAPEKSKIPILSESFMYGYGVFETLRTYNKKPFKTKEHIDRLYKSAKIINLKIKEKKSDIEKMVNKISKKSTHKNQRIKIIAIKEGIFLVSIKLTITPDIYKGVSCKAVKCTRHLPKAKTLSYLDSYLSHTKAEKNGYFEALLVNDNQEILEGAYSNIFWFEKNSLCTPEKNVLEGITRQTIIDISPYKIKFKTIKLKDLLKKSEIFLTQTTTGIIPITKINNKLLNSGNPGTKTLELMERFSLFSSSF